MLSLMLSYAAFAQDITVRISPADSTGRPLQNVTAQVYTGRDSLLLEKIIQPATIFILTAGRNYHIVLTSVSAQKTLCRFTAANSDTVLNIVMKPSLKDLDAVVITSRKPLIAQDDDKTSIDAEVLAGSSSNAYEVLEKTPGAVVDQDGNVYLNSATPAMIQINGKEVKLSAADVATLLKSLPANSVSRIEVLRNPSAKFDAASTGGIINIVLKKGIRLGTSGSVNAAWFRGKYNTKTIGFNLNRSLGKTSSYLSYQYNNRNNFEALNSNRYFNDTLIAQRSYTRYPSMNHYVSFGLSKDFTAKLSVGLDSRLSTNSNDSRADNNVDNLTVPTQLLNGKTNSYINNNGTSFYSGNSINSTYKIDSPGSTWTASLDYNYYKYNNTQLYDNAFSLPFSDNIKGDGKTNNDKTIIVLASDLTLKTRKKYTIETGFKITYSNSRNDALYFVDSGYGRRPDNFQTNRFNYREEISSVYLQVSKTFLGFTLKPGLRAEHTDINGLQLFPRDTALSIRRTDLFPYVYLRHDLIKVFGFQLTGNAIYRRSISRPYYETLNPYPKYIDQYLYDVGNPSLQPQFTSNYEFNINADQFPVFSVGINDIHDIFTNVTYQDSVTKIAYRTYDNLGRNKETYLRIVGGIPPGKKYFFYAGAQYNHADYSGIYQNAVLAYKRGSWTFFMYHNYKPTAGFNIGINAFMRLHGLQNFYELKSFGQLNITANQAILKKKMNVILSVNDLLRTNHYSFKLQQAAIIANGTRANDSRRVGITLRYNFGLKPKEEKQAISAEPKTDG